MNDKVVAGSSNTKLVQYLEGCAALGEQLGDDGLAYVSPVELRKAIALLGGAPETFVQSPAATDVLAERRRQVTAEGWTPERDDEYTFGELSEAASAYLRHVALHWPNGWDRAWYKPTTRRRDLFKSAALIIAEIERLDRANELKAAVLPTEICPTGDDYPHKAHKGKCMYCGAPMPSLGKSE